MAEEHEKYTPDILIMATLSLVLGELVAELKAMGAIDPTSLKRRLQTIEDQFRTTQVGDMDAPLGVLGVVRDALED
jgi:hypothetical protein